MYVEQLYTGCLAEAAYYIESNGEAAIIDPLRETQPYIELARQRGARIKYVFETHFHADFVSGHVDLARKTGATIVFGPNAQPNYDAYIGKDDEIFPLGNVNIQLLHTPGHTMESSTFLLKDEQGNNHSIYTGDTLFIGDVGRPDLAVKSNLTQEDLAGHLYDSLYNKILPLEDEVIVYPGHGAGSACGKMMSEETFSTLGNQRKFNYALQPMSREEFVAKVLDGLVAPPQYFPKNAVMNKMGYTNFDQVLEKGMLALEVKDFAQLAEDPASLVIDTRQKEMFMQGFIPGSWYIGIEDNFAPWLGALVKDLNTPILIVGEEDKIEEVVTRMSRVGYDNGLGYLKGGITAWIEAGKELDTLESITAEDFEKVFHEDAAFQTLDVRKKSEFVSTHIRGAINYPLDSLLDTLDELSANELYYVHCAGGYRSTIAASILKSVGFNKLVNVEGGFKALSQTQLPKTDYVAPTTML